MRKAKFLITGATGTTGRPSVELLLQKGFEVRAFVHKEDERSENLQKLGAEIFVGDLQNLPDVRKAWEGIKRGYFCPPLNPAIIEATVIFAQAAREAGAEFIVNLSQKQVTSTSKSPATIRHFLSEEVFNWSGIPATNLRPTFFSEWFLYVSGQIKKGKLKMSFPADALHAPVAGEDIGRTIAAILSEPECHAGQTYQLFGPELMTFKEQGGLISRILEKDIVYEQVSVQEMADLIGIGGWDYFKDHIGSTVGDGVFGLPNFNNKIEEITGVAPMDLRSFIEKNRAAFIG